MEANNENDGKENDEKIDCTRYLFLLVLCNLKLEKEDKSVIPKIEEWFFKLTQWNLQSGSTNVIKNC